MRLWRWHAHFSELNNAISKLIHEVEQRKKKTSVVNIINSIVNIIKNIIDIENLNPNNLKNSFIA